MGAGRTGTVTFLFTDIEGSTQRWAEDEDAMGAALVRHDEVLRSAIEACRGDVVKHTGDGVVAVFDSAIAAVRAARDAQAALDLPVRMGLHTGEAERRGNDYFGNTLNRCARIMDAAHGGQILVSSATRELLGEVDVAIVDLGRHRLKGIDEPLAVHQIGTDKHPPLRSTIGDVRLPVLSSELVGRDELVQLVVDQLDDHRMLTLTGVGGAGKTRVAVAAAAARADRHELVALVDLGEVSDDEEVLPAACRALGVADHRASTLGIAVSGRSVLLVLDNCEHVLDATAQLASELLRVPGLRLLATSREGLGIDGERLLAVPGLAADEIDSAAVRMFVDRSRTARTRIIDDDLPTVREICRRLDGLPLAIELAAARVAVLSPGDLLARLDERFDLLTGGRRKRSRDRQKTLRETIDWSYELLDDDERDVFELMSVFGGSFGLDSAVEIARGRPEYEMLDLLEALIDKSLLTTVDVEGVHRYRYLETIRSYAEDRFEARTDAEDVRATFRAHLAALVRDLADDAMRNDLVGAARRLRAEIPNLRKGFDQALDRHDIDCLSALIVPIALNASLTDWRINGWAAEALALDGVRGSRHEPQLLAPHLVDLWLEGRFDVLHELTDRMLAAQRRHGVRSDAVDRIAVAGYQLSGDDDGLHRLADDLIDRADPDGPVHRHLNVWLAWVHQEPFSLDLPSRWSADDEAAVDRGLSSGDVGERLAALAVRGLRARVMGDFDLMLRCGSEIADESVPGSPVWFTGLQIRSFAEFYLGRIVEAIRTADANLDEAYKLGDRSAMVLPLLLDALVLEALDEIEPAATLRGRLPRRLTVMFIRELTELDRRLHERLPPDRLRELVVAGADMTPRELQALTRRALQPHLDPDARGASG